MTIMESQELKTYEEPLSIRRRKTLQKSEADTIGIDLVIAWLRIIRTEYNAALRLSKKERNGYEERIAARLIEDIRKRGGFGMLWIGALPEERVKLRSDWERALKRTLAPVFVRAITTWEGFKDVA